jgi:hypothetical protein
MGMPRIAPPGIVLLEGSTLAEVRAEAQKEKLDFVLIADIKSQPRPKGVTWSTLEIYIRDANKWAESWKSKQVNHVKIMAAQQSTGSGKDKVEDPVPGLIKDILGRIDQQFRLVEMPEISREAVLKHVAAVTAVKPANCLPLLLELRYYQSKKLLTDQEFAEYAGKIAGAEEGQRLATGAEAERKQVVEPWLSAVRRD